MKNPTLVFIPESMARVLRCFGQVLLISLMMAKADAADTMKIHFDLPAAGAEKSLRELSHQAGVEVVFPTNYMRGITTQPVKGDFTPLEALTLMLAGTEFVSAQDEKSGALTVQPRDAKAESEKNSNRPPRSRSDNEDPAVPGKSSRANDIPTTAAPAKANEDEVIRMDTFHVTTTLGKYKEVGAFTGSKTPMELKDISASIQVLNAAFIGDLRAQSLEDLYPYVIGMTREGTTAAGFTLRGFSNSNPDVTLNNVEVDSLPGLASRWGSANTANVDRVEILKGPASVLYGLLNPGGIVNIITKQPQEVRAGSFFGSFASFAGTGSPLGEDTGFMATLDTTGPIDQDKHWLYRFIASVDQLPAYRNNAYFHDQYFYPSLTYRWSKDTQITLQIEITRQTRFSDSGLVAPFNNTSLVARREVTYQNPGSNEYDGGQVYTTIFQHHFADSWILRISTRDVQHRDGRSLFENNGIVAAANIVDSAVIRRYRLAANVRKYNLFDANVSGTLGDGAVRHTVLAGVSAGNEVQDFNRPALAGNGNNVNVYNPDVSFDPPIPTPPVSPADPVSRFYNYGAYASDQIKVGQKWRASVGVRYDKQDANLTDNYAGLHRHQSVHSTVPSGGLMFQPTDAISIYASYAASFRPATPATVDATGASGFPSEKARQIEVGVKAEFPAQKLTGTLSFYDIIKRNVTETVPNTFLPDGTVVSRVDGAQESKGIEAELVYLPQPYWQFDLGYSYIDARVTASINPAILNARLFNVPRNHTSLWTRYNVPEGALRGFGVGLGLIQVGSRVGAITNNTAALLPMAGYTRIDCALYYQWKRYSFALNVTNAGDREYLASIRNNLTIVAGEPRKITLSLRMPF